MGWLSGTDRTSSLDASLVAAHADGMRWIALAAMLSGCFGLGGSDPTGGAGNGGTTGNGGSGGNTTIFNSWVVELNGGQPPSCAGPMNTTWTQDVNGGPITVAGSWSCIESAVECTYIREFQDANFTCISYGGAVNGEITGGGATTLDLDTLPGFGTRVTGTTSASSIVGTAAFSNANIPFLAVLQ